MEENGLEDFIKALEDAQRTGKADFTIGPPDGKTTREDVARMVRAATPSATFCRGEAYKIARTLVDTGFVREISVQQFIAIVEIIYQLQTKNAPGQGI